MATFAQRLTIPLSQPRKTIDSMVNRSSAPALWFIVEIHPEEKPLYLLNSRYRLLSLRLSLRFALLLVLLCAASCKHSGPVGSGEIMYVSAPQANLRDHVATVYNRVGTVKNGDRVEVLERQKRFVRVRTAQKVEGWIELRALVPSEIYDQFQQLSKDNRTTPVEGHGVTRVELNMHVTPGRETDTLYQLAENSKVEMLKRVDHRARHSGRDRRQESSRAGPRCRRSAEAQAEKEARKPAPPAAPIGKGRSRAARPTLPLAQPIRKRNRQCHARARPRSRSLSRWTTGGWCAISRDTSAGCWRAWSISTSLSTWRSTPRASASRRRLCSTPCRTKRRARFLSTWCC